MRAAAAAMGMLVALSTPAAAQPAGGQGSSWRAAVSAALAFGHAEGKAAAFAGYSIRAAPTSKKDTDEALDKLDRLAQGAREAFLFVERYGSPFWTAAAQLRVGDLFWCQADKIVTIPPPPQVPQGMPPPLLNQYREVLEGLVEPLRRQAHQSWERAAASDASPFWSRGAWERLTRAAPPDC